MKTKFNFLSKIAAIFALALGIVSCQEASLGDNTAAKGGELINFSASFEGVTRGSIIGNEEFDSFTLYAYNGEDLFIESAKFTLENGVWSTDQSYYWPESSTELTFYAYTPAMAGADNGFTFDNGVISYNMDGVSNSDLPDITTAYTRQSSANVELEFSRAISVINFNVSGTGSDIESVTVSGIVDAGEYNIAKGEWNSESATANIYSAGIGEAVDGQITTESGYIMVIPQTTIEIIITATNEDQNSEEYSLDVDWTAGNLYSYDINSEGIKPANPDHDPSRGLFDLDEYSNDYNGQKEFESDVDLAIANGVTLYVITGEYSGEDMIFGSGNKFQDITVEGAVVDFSGVISFPTTFVSNSNALQVKDSNNDCTVEEFIFPVTDSDAGTNGIETVYLSAFDNSNIKRITIPEATEIQNYAFHDCFELTYIDLPDATTFGVNVFDSCDALTTLKLTAEGEFSCDSDMFDNFTTSESCTLYLNIDKRDDITNEETKYWEGLYWYAIIFINEDGSIFDPDAEVIVSTNDHTSSSFGSSNCYMLHPSSSGAVVYYIPVEDRINEFWGNNGYEDNDDYCLEDGDEWTTEILWGDVTTFEGFATERVTSGFTATNCSSAMKVHVPTNFNHGNIVVAVKKDGVVLWSWHFWITNYNPDEAYGVSVVNEYGDSYCASYAVTGGYVERYKDDDTDTRTAPYVDFKIWSNYYELYYDKTIHVMDRFIGATGRNAAGYGSLTNSLQGSGALYYQFGRKDPFPGTGAQWYDGSKFSPEDYTITTAQTVAFSVANPTRFVETATDWTTESKYNSTEIHWQDPNFKAGSMTTYNSNYKYPSEDYAYKSIFDPSPLGWRMPNWLTWNWFDTYNHVGKDMISTYSFIYLNENSLVMYFATGYRNGSDGDLKDGGNTIWTWSNHADYTMKFSSANSYYKVEAFQSAPTTSTALPVRPVRQKN